MGIPFWKSALFFIAVTVFSGYLFPSQRELGMYYSASKNFNNARFYLEKQYHKDPGDENNARRYLRALIYNGEYALFERVTKKLLPENPNAFWLNEIMADYFEDKMDFREAGGYWFKLLAKDPEQGEVRDKIVSYCLRDKNTDLLIRVYEMEKARLPFNAEIYGELARLYCLKRMPGKAEKIYLEWLRQTPGDAGVSAKLAEVYECEGKADEALALYREIADRNPKNKEYALRVIEKLIFYKRGEELLDTLDQYTKRFPDSEEFPKMLADFYLRLGKREESVRMLKAFYETHPEYHKALASLGEIYFSMGNFTEARDTLRKYHEKTDGDYHSHHVLGDVLAALGDENGSRREYRQALDFIRER